MLQVPWLGKEGPRLPKALLPQMEGKKKKKCSIHTHTLPWASSGAWISGSTVAPVHACPVRGSGSWFLAADPCAHPGQGLGGQLCHSLHLYLTHPRVRQSAHDGGSLQLPCLRLGQPASGNSGSSHLNEAWGQVVGVILKAHPGFLPRS